MFHNVGANLENSQNSVFIVDQNRQKWHKVGKNTGHQRMAKMTKVAMLLANKVGHNGQWPPSGLFS